MSKEVIINTEAHSVKHAFSFWANLMTTADSEACEYPSQTSRLGVGGGWQSLETTLAIRPPVVELVD